MAKSSSKTFEDFLLKRGVIEKKDLQDVEKMKDDANVSLGIIALNRGLLTHEEVVEILKTQSETKKRFGQAAIQLKLLDRNQIRRLLAEQEKINFDAGEILVFTGRLSAETLKKERRAFARRNR